MISGRTYSGREASLMGLINRAVPKDKLAEEVMNEARRIAVIPLDGIVSGKAYTHMVWESMGMGAAFTELYFGHTLGLKLRFEDGDFGFFREARAKGATTAVEMRRNVYAPFGGYGPEAERPIIPMRGMDPLG